MHRSESCQTQSQFLGTLHILSREQHFRTDEALQESSYPVIPHSLLSPKVFVLSMDSFVGGSSLCGCFGKYPPCWLVSLDQLTAIRRDLSHALRALCTTHFLEPSGHYVSRG